LPPIRRDLKKNLQKIVVLKLDQNSGKKHIERKEKGDKMEGNFRIHAFDPQNISMPEYSSSYLNANAG